MLITNERPAYRILSEKGFFGPDDHLYHEGDCIYFDGIPNEDFEPLNEPARKQMEDLFASLDAAARKAAEKAGREYSGRPKSLEAAIALSRQDARQVQLINGGPGVPLMGAKNKDAPKIEKIEEAETPQTGRKTGRGGSLSIGKPAA